MEYSNDEYFKTLAKKELEELGQLPSDPNIELAKAGGSTASRAKINIERGNDDKDLDSESEGQLTIDVYQTPAEIVVESAIAGVNPDDLDINVTNDSITIKGKRHREKTVKDEDYFYQECYWGRFSRSVILPQEVDADAASATFKNGILTIRLPKLKREKNKKVKVRLE